MQAGRRQAVAEQAAAGCQHAQQPDPAGSGEVSSETNFEGDEKDKKRIIKVSGELVPLIKETVDFLQTKDAK